MKRYEQKNNWNNITYISWHGLSESIDERWRMAPSCPWANNPADNWNHFANATTEKQIGLRGYFSKSNK